MSETRSELEAQLLRRPFDLDLRLRYASLLEAEESWRDSLEQYEILVEAIDDAAPWVGAARCLLRLGDVKGAGDRYAKAQGRAGLVPDDELESLIGTTRRSTSRLRVVDPTNVVTLVPKGAVPVTFGDVAGMGKLKELLRLQIIEPFSRPELFAKFKKRAGGGVLLYGPPGCGKTLMARAIAGECSAEFLSVEISDVLNLWLGESERNLAALFDRARSSRPAVLFFDELDSLAYSRSKASSHHSRTVVNEFLSQLDGFGKDNEGVLVLAATNMPWDVDPAMKRPGRFSKQIFVPPPDEAARRAMFEMKLADMPIEAIDYTALAKLAEHFSGADIDGVIDEARDRVLARILASGEEREMRQVDLHEAIDNAQPSTMDWLRTARNLVKYAGADTGYRDVEKYLKSVRLV